MKFTNMNQCEELRRAFADGRLYVLEASTLIPTATHYRSACCGTPKGEQLRKISVISVPAGGEIRGYFHDESTGDLHLTLPARPALWPELDNLVQLHLGAKRVHTTEN